MTVCLLPVTVTVIILLIEIKYCQSIIIREVPPVTNATPLLDFNCTHYKIGNVCINQNDILGIGSIGTIVFGGQLDGREVAIKRMLQQFNTAAEKEISLLMLSDTNPYIIRYFTKEVDR